MLCFFLLCRCEHTLGNAVAEAHLLTEAARCFLQGEQQLQHLQVPSFSEQLNAAINCYSHAIRVRCIYRIAKGVGENVIGGLRAVHGERGARVCYGSQGAEPSAGSRSKAPGLGVKPPENENFVNPQHLKKAAESIPLLRFKV